VPDISFNLTNDPQQLRSRLLEFRAKLQSFASTAEQACYEVERRWRVELAKISPSTEDASAVISQAKRTPPKQMPLVFDAETPEASPIPLLDAINDLITAEEEEEGWDLLKVRFLGVRRTRCGLMYACATKTHA
jgi:hypothetical protein